MADVQALAAVLRPDADGRSYLQQARERHAPFLREVKGAKPADADNRQWRSAIEGLESFLLSGWADEAQRLGWPKDELYAVPPLWARVDLCGAGLLIGDREVVGITSNEIRIKTASGATLAFYRKPTVDYGLIFETHLKLTRGNFAGDLRSPGCAPSSARFASFATIIQTPASKTPRPRCSPPSPRRKRRFEMTTGSGVVCAGQLDVRETQRAVADDWIEAYPRYFAPAIQAMEPR